MEPDILLVDDDADEIDLALIAFERAGLKDRLAVAASGSEALSRLLGAPGTPLPKAVLLDVKMPRVSGFDVLRRLKEDPAMAAVMVIMLSSSIEPGDLVESRRLGADAYWAKPVR